MEKWKKIAAHIGAYPAALAKWLAVGALIGGIGGVIGSLFHIGVNYATQMRAAHPWILYLLPALGLIIVGLYRVTKVEGKDTNAVIESVHFGKNVPVLLVPVIFISTVLTHLGGGSAGRSARCAGCWRSRQNSVSESTRHTAQEIKQRFAPCSRSLTRRLCVWNAFMMPIRHSGCRKTSRMALTCRTSGSAV